MDSGNTHAMEETQNDEEAKTYALRGKIMLISILILFIILIIMLCLHLYLRRRLRRPRRRPHFVFYLDPSLTPPTRGLHASLIASLPLFNFSPNTHPDPLDCPVCLSEFEDGETGRVLPKCSHTFHTDCIDMWFRSHSTCPICRAPVEPITRPEPVSTECEPEPGRGPNEVNIELARTNEGFGHGSGCETPSSTTWSPMSRVLSLKRILSRERKASVSPPSSGCSSTAELDDAERGDSVTRIG